ncbi:MAG: DUF72 domain-containing protein [Henriciella sp.]|uniref:DUF72 domain-containing protein n=1 Tax=Henriciella sp. TaxID=1968823 RepID=UPI0032ECD409
MTHPIRIGIGGWNYEPWEETFYPDDLAKKRQLEYASQQLTAIEINSTFYRNQKPHVFENWAGETPDGFKFTVKAQRFTTSRKTPDEMKEAIDWFVGGGVTKLGDRLGAINWQFPKGRTFDADYFSAFLERLPKEHDGVALRHAIEVRNETFKTEEFTDLLKTHGCALVFSDAEDWPMPDVETAGFAYARLQESRETYKAGYAPKALDGWAGKLKAWAKTRDVYAFFISGAKARDPLAAMALIDRVGRPD